jgi:hypothetical protein
MEGTSPGKKRRFRIHREFECSRIEQAMLAAAYRRVLPEDRLSFAESNRDPIDRCQEASQPASQDNTDSPPTYVSARGGH